MDAYDIFKKITRGCKFNRKTTNKAVNKVSSAIPADSSVKTELNNEEIVVKQEPLDISEEDDENNTESSEITLLDSMTATEHKRRKNKRKASEDLNDDKKRMLLEQEKINQYRNQNNINVVGRHVPEPAKTFEDFGVAEDIIENLKKCGYVEPTPIQKQAVPIMLQNRQMLACAPTGSGKTAAFLVPIINALEGPRKKGFRALILCPTRELAKQTQRECVRLSMGRGFRIHVISKINKALSQYGPKSSQKFDILVTTPNRVCFLLNQDPPALSLENVEWLVVDEADKLFETGSRGFREQLDKILESCSNKNRKIAMFSATHTPAVAKWCVHNMRGLIRVTIGQRNAATDLVDQELLFVGSEQGKLIAFRDIVRKGINPPVLVFVQSKERAQQLFNELIYDGIRVDAIHADRTQLQRDNTVRSFREGKIWVLICTELMARGVDFKGVNLVINYDFPPSVISYVHRVGRAGRAGRKGKAVTFFTLDDTVNLRSIAHVVKQSGCEVPDYMLAMKKRPKKEMKKLQHSAPERDDISTRPVYEVEMKRRRMQGRRGKLRKPVLPDTGSKDQCAVNGEFTEKSKDKKRGKDFKGKSRVVNGKKKLGVGKKLQNGQKKVKKNKVKE